MTRRNRSEMQIAPVIGLEFNYRIHADFVGPLKESTNGNLYIFTTLCELSKYFTATPVVDTSTVSAANALFKYFLVMGWPVSICTDNGPAFISSLMKQITKLCSIKHTNILIYSPRGLNVERNHKEMNTYIRCFCDRENDWESVLPFFVYSYNNTVHETTGLAPNFLVFGKVFSLPDALAQHKRSAFSYHDYVNNIRMNIEKGNELASERIMQRRLYNKERYDIVHNVKELPLTEKSLILVEKKKRKKHEPYYIGPFVVESIRGTTVTYRDKNRIVKCHRDMVKQAQATYGNENEINI